MPQCAGVEENVQKAITQLKNFFHHHDSSWKEIMPNMLEWSKWRRFVVTMHPQKIKASQNLWLLPIPDSFMLVLSMKTMKLWLFVENDGPAQFLYVPALLGLLEGE